MSQGGFPLTPSQRINGFYTKSSTPGISDVAFPPRLAGRALSPPLHPPGRPQQQGLSAISAFPQRGFGDNLISRRCVSTTPFSAPFALLRGHNALARAKRPRDSRKGRGRRHLRQRVAIEALSAPQSGRTRTPSATRSPGWRITVSPGSRPSRTWTRRPLRRPVSTGRRLARSSSIT